MFDAAEQYLKRLDPLKEIILLDSSYDNEFGVTRTEKLPIVEAFRQTLSILPVAFFEDFLRMMIEQFIDKLNSLNPRIDWSELPLPLRKAHIFDTPLHFRKKPPDGDDETYQLKCLNDLRNILGKIISPLITPNGYIIAVESLTNTNSNPDSDTVKLMYKNIGIKNIFNEPRLLEAMSLLDTVYDSSERIKWKLNEIVERRHGVAHGRPASGITRNDLESNIRFLGHLVVALQNESLNKYRKIAT